MANVLVEESSLSAIADSIRAKNGTATTYKPAEMSGAIDALPTGGGTMQSKSVSYTPSETAQSGTVTPDVGYDGLSRVSVSVGAIDDEYVGSGITRRSVADLDLTGAKFTAPAGYYASDADKTMMTGHMSVSATKGSVSNHSVSVTPKAAVDNAGYFATGDRTGTAVSVSASELVSGSETKTQNGTYDVTNLAELVVNVSAPAPSLQTKSVSYTPTTSSQSAQVTPDTGYDGLSKVNVSVAAMPSGTAGTPTATKGAVSNHSVSVTPSVTNTAGYIGGGTKTGTAVTVSASELDSGTKAITSNGNSQDVVGYAAVNVAVPNSYTAADEGKVVDNGALVAQTSDTVTDNGTYDTTLINSLLVNVSGSGGIDFDDYISSPPTFPSGDYVTSVTSIRPYAFAYLAENNTNAQTWPEWKIHAPNCTYIGANAFRNCRTLTEAHFPNLTSFESTNYILYMPSNGTRKLAVVDWGKANLTSNTFQYANNLKTLILRKTSIATINNVNVFNGTPFANGGSGGTIYIPKSLYDHLGDGTSSDYKAATNWSTVNGYGTITWAQIEGSQYEL